jgi:ferredoxin
MLQTSKSDLIETIITDETSRGIGQNGIEITIDRKKCNYSMYDPKGCKTCLQICPLMVFATRPVEKRDFTIPPKERIDPTDWLLLPTWADWCNGCTSCVKECPKGAITIQFGERLIAP